MIERMETMFSHDLLYYIHSSKYTTDELTEQLRKHTEIRFVSLVGVDLGGNDTDEKIPIDIFLADMEQFLTGAGVQTDGSSVVLPGIATLNDGKVDLVPDSSVKWFVDYNYDHLDPISSKPVGTLRIPSFLHHNGRRIDSRSILQSAATHFRKEIMQLLSDHPDSLEELQITLDEIESVVLTSATELEFWVKTPEDDANVDALSASQIMQEQYWKRTKGLVRTCLEKSLMLLDCYGLEAEMGHKEVGGVKAKIDSHGNLSHIMEQLEIDWKYAPALQAADNELVARTKIKEVFQNHGMEVSFMAKPIEGVAGNGEHTHLGVALKLKNGTYRNLFSPAMMEDQYINRFGWGALMGILKNYEVTNPFISGTMDALNRLQPGFEAPVCIVASIGHTLQTPSRNRTVLVGLIRDLDNPMATRFEVRSPNPHSNTYLTMASLYQSALDGIRAAISTGRSAQDLEAEFNKAAGETGTYLETGRQYRSEEDIFEDFSKEERDRYFGVHPATVWENLQAFTRYPEKADVLKHGGVFTDAVIHSYATGCRIKWATEVSTSLIPQAAKEVSRMVRVHTNETANPLDLERWEEITRRRVELMKDSPDSTSIFTLIRASLEEESYDEVSRLQLIMKEKLAELRELYTTYKRNIISL